MVLAAALPAFVNFWQMSRIMSLRKKHDIKYPTMVSEKHKDFNCAQRAHHNTLELLPFFFPALLLGGIRYPLYAGITGAVFSVGRVMYSLGYYTGNPEKRVPGALISEVALVGLLGLNILTGANILGWW